VGENRRTSRESGHLLLRLVRVESLRVVQCRVRCLRNRVEVPRRRKEGTSFA